MSSFTYKIVDISNGELDLTRISLLKRILSESHETSSMDSLKDKYNQIVEAQITQNRSVFDDPIDIFPAEIWIGIIWRAVVYEDGKSVERVLPLTLVSKRWRDAILICPELWAEIKLGPGLGQPDMMAMLETCLYLSGSYPLSLFIEHPTRDWDIMASMLLSHTARVEAIYIRPLVSKYVGELDEEEPTVSQVLSSFGPLPRLHTLELDTPRVIDWDSFIAFVEEAPLIRKISRRWIPHDVLPKARLEFIKEIPIRSNPALLLPWLSGHPSLEFLEHVSADPEVNHTTILPSVSMSSIRILRSYSHIDSYLAGLLMASRQLEELKIKVSWRMMAELLQILEILPQLNELDLEIEYSNGPDSVFNPQLAQFTSNIRCVYITHGPLLIRDGESSTMQSNMTRLYEIMENCLSRVENLNITTMEYFTVPIEYLVSLSRLHTLGLIFRDVIPIHQAEFKGELPKVQFLYLQMRPAMMSQVLSSILCRNISTLCLDAVRGENIVAPHTLELDPLAYQSLETLELKEPLLHWNPTSLNQLRRLLLKSTDSATASDFCVYLAKRPYDLPNLDKIDFRNYPEWDCLFIMLERRNFLPILGVSPIRKLTFPSTLAPAIRHLLANLLRGCFTPRLPNRDLSLVGLGEVYWDQSIPGCHYCCMSMQSCNSPIIGARYQPMGHWKQLICNEYVEKLSSEPPLPLEVEAWLSGRQARYKKWNLMKEKWTDTIRRNVCDNHELGWKRTLTGLTFSDAKGAYLDSLNLYRYLQGTQTNTASDE